MERHYTRGLVGNAKALRRRMTPSEKRLWSALRKNRLSLWRFRRQQPVGPYIVDFYCSEAKLILELDGESHVKKESSDKARDDFFKHNGIDVFRVWDSQVFDNPEGILALIFQRCAERTGHH